MLLEISIGALGLVAIVKLAPLAERFLPIRLREQLAHDRWRASCRRRGLTPEQQQEEYLFRLSTVRIGRVASTAVLRNPARFREIIDETINAECSIVASSDKRLAARISATLKVADLDEILTPAAEAAAMRTVGFEPIHLTPQAYEDHLAALTTSR